MSEARGGGGTRTGEGRRRLVLAGRLVGRRQGRIQLELADGLMVDVAEDDCLRIREQTDPASLRTVVVVDLKGDQPITTTFQPHLYRVLADVGSLPLVFGGSAGVSPESFTNALVMARQAQGSGSGGGSDHETAMLCTTWYGATVKDGTKGDSASEPGEIYL